jgi:hypothetical protein
MAKRQAKEAVLKNGAGIFEGIDLPGPFDVLLGRGKPFHVHPGNQHLRALVDLIRDEYEGAQYGAKPAIAAKIVASIKQNRGRFLKKDKDGWWVEAPDKAAKEKVGHTFRTARLANSASNKAELGESWKRARIETPKTTGCFCSTDY